MKQNNRIRDSLNENLSGLYVSREQHAELMNEITGGRKVKRKLTASLVLAMVLVLLAAVALAWGLSYSPDVTITRDARSAVMEKYGLSRDAMDMFYVKVAHGDQGTTIRFAAPEELAENFAPMGIYTVEIARDGSTTVQWSHDDVDPATWADGSLDDEVWGEKQILAYRAKRDRENRLMMGRGSSNEAFINEIVAETEAPPLPQQGKLTEEQVLGIAKTAMKETFGFSDETLTLFDGYAGFGETEEQALGVVVTSMQGRFSLYDEALMLFDAYPSVSKQGGDAWVVVHHPTNMAKSVLMMTIENAPLGDYAVTISDETGGVLQARWSLKGKDEKTYTKHTWGQANAYSAKTLPWVLELVNTCAPLIQKGEASGVTLSVEDKAAHDQAFRDAGFDETRYNHVLPQAGDIPYAKAVEIAAQVLSEECGVSRAVFDASGFAYADLLQEKDHREWYFWVQNMEEQCGWTVVFDAETGEILLVGADPFANSNG